MPIRVVERLPAPPPFTRCAPLPLRPRPRRRAACLLLALAGSVAPSVAAADFGRTCEPRAISPAERAAVERATSALRAALPPAPAGWKVRDEQAQAGGTACEVEGEKGLVPQPIFVRVLRQYVRDGEPPRPEQAAASAPAQGPAAPDDPDAAARIRALEAQLADLKRSDQEAIAAFQAARRAGDAPAQAAARQRDQDLRLAMRPVQQELSTLRSAQHRARAVRSQELTQAAQSHAREVEENRRDASVSISLNLRQLDAGTDAESLDVPGASVALRDRQGRVHLLLGSWRYTRDSGWAVATIDEHAAPPRVQTVAVQIDGNAGTVATLRAGVGLAGLKALVSR